MPGGRHIYLRAASTAERQQWLLALGVAKQEENVLDSGMEWQNPVSCGEILMRFSGSAPPTGWPVTYSSSVSFRRGGGAWDTPLKNLKGNDATEV